ncbi:MAG TPA: hypothetical protein VL749_03900 [Patescibacteria group bacterium]|nr:hypothetical protein [Patescibacteria group bacterium]
MGSTPRPWETDPAPWGGAEIEELPAQPVLARGRGRGRPGLSAAAAVVVLVIIIAAGSGVLGGRPNPSPTSHPLAAASAPPSPAPATAAAPLVTPAVPCLPLARALPEIRLIVEGRGIVGARNAFEWTQPGVEPTPAIVLQDSSAGRTELRSDVLAELRTVGDACASAWSIDLATADDALTLEDFGGAPGGEGSAMQNRFALDLARYRGRDADLRAELSFPGVTLQTTWPIQILPFDAPTAQLSRGDRSLDVVPGCDIRLVLGTGYAELANPCFADLGRLPRTASIASAGDPLVFRFPAGWRVDGPSVECGSIAGDRFQLEPDCEIGWGDETAALSILGPGEGIWTLAISACATQLLPDATNSACGTWYATIEVRRSAR